MSPSRQSQESNRRWFVCSAEALLCTLVLFLTLAVFPTSLNPGLPILLGGVLAILAAVGLATLGTGPYNRPTAHLFIALLLWLTVCTLFTVDEYLSRRSLATFVGAFAFFMSVRIGCTGRRQWSALTYTLIAICGLASVHAWVSALSQMGDSGALPRLQGTFVNPDTFSILPLLGLCLLLGMVQKAEGFLAYLNLFLAGFLLLTVIATGCRSSIVAFVVAGLVFMASIFRRGSKGTEKTRVLVGFPLILAVLAVPLLGFQLPTLSKWTRMLEDSAMQTEEMRLELMKYGWKAMFNHPLLGSGPGTFGLSYQSVRPPTHNTLYVNIAHNDLIEMGTEAGLLGFALWIVLTWFAFKIPWDLVRDGRRPTEAAAVSCAVAALFTYSLFNFIIVQRPVFWAQAWLFALAYSFPSSREKSEEPLPLRYAVSALLLAFGTWTAFVGWKSLHADALYVQAQAEEESLHLERSEQLYREASELEPPRVAAVLQRVANLEKLRLFQGEENLPTQLEILQEAREASPLDTSLLSKLAEIQIKLDKMEQAKETLAFARKQAPYKIDLYESQLELFLATGDLEGAAKSLAEWIPVRGANTGEFVKVLYTLTRRDPKRGREVAGDWLREHPDEKGAGVVGEAAALAQKKKDWQVELVLLQSLKESRPDDLCLSLTIGRNVRDREGENGEFAYLSDSRSRLTEQLDPCYDKLLQRWSALGLKLGKTEEVETVLREFLQIDPGKAWARVRLASLKAEAGHHQEAVKLLREGLERNPNDAELVFSLAQVFEKQGSRNLALNYYRDAVRLDPKNKQAGIKVKTLSGRK